MDPLRYPAAGRGLPHILRDEHNADSFTAHPHPGGPLSICTIAGDDWRTWSEAAPRVFKPLGGPMRTKVDPLTREETR